tara:strand:- start:3513 stop:5069 length:1557 start_codon:yes stop_codon:yes gene_type:complete
MIINNKFISYFILFIFIFFSVLILQNDNYYFDCNYFEELHVNGCYGEVQLLLDTKQKLMLLGMLVIFSFVFIYFFYSREEKNFFPIFYMITIYFFLSYFIYFLFYPKVQLAEFDNNMFPIFEQSTSIYDIIFSSQVFLIGLLFFNLGYFILNFSNINNFLKLDSLNSFLKIKDLNELLIISLIINFITFTFFYLINLGEIFHPIKQLKFIFVYLSVGINIFFYFNFKNNLRYLFLLPIIILILVEFFEASLAVPFMLMLYVYFLFFSVKRKFFIIPILLIFLLGSFYNFIKDDYRKIFLPDFKIENKTYFDKEEPFNKIKAFVHVSKKKILEIKDFKDLKEDLLYNSLFKRIFHSGRSLLIVTAKTPETVPYFNGESHKLLYVKLIPRLFWPNKPKDELGNEFGKRYKVLTEADTGTSWNMPVLNEFYVNYGLKGIIFGMFLLGNFFYVLTRFFPLNNNQSYILIIGSIIVYPLFNLESHLSQSLGNILTSFIFMIILIFFLKKIILFLNLKIIKETN